ncbi:hypothetical protein JQ633_06765 [Bradyrhizobium tropiciagri]|uniref:hypothetical protein n=1 Tax=Bradyrhizobium tropiciagri TaxID=312253 RepID=UPI001BAA559A|nr:hypothetical protein [Bradyrhizobium tropiciagri]MBR0870052.1 hypothetical protein [Bradyrhizobium tropiciagri]
MRLLLIVILGAALASNVRAAAEDGPECFSKRTKFNVCEKAREAQAGLAATLPLKMNANITMSTAIVVGPRLILTAIWNIDKAEFDARLRANNTTVADLTAKMDVATQNSVCSMELMAAFVRLGGQVQYLYRTLDGATVLSPLVAAC